MSAADTEREIRELFAPLFASFEAALGKEAVMLALDESNLDEAVAQVALEKAMTLISAESSEPEICASPSDSKEAKTDSGANSRVPSDAEDESSGPSDDDEDESAEGSQLTKRLKLSDAGLRSKRRPSEILARVTTRPPSDTIYEFEFPDEDAPDGSEKMYYLIKWHHCSYAKSTWISKDLLCLEDDGAKARVRNFEAKKRDSGDLADSQPPYFNPDFSVIQRILAMRNSRGKVEYLCKWRSLDHDHCTWETDVDAESLETYQRFSSTVDDKAALNSARLAADARVALANRSELSPFDDGTRGYGVDGKLNLRSYQIEGLDWLRFSWMCRRSVILADEMGLGKTAQSVTFLEWLRRGNGLIRGPFLVVAPRSCVEQWQRELERWTDMRVLLYVGGQTARETARKFEFHRPAPHPSSSLGFDVLVTSYETVDMDVAYLKKIPWAFSIIDEAHKLKNENNLAFRNLRSLDAGTGRLLLTGTPIQNNMAELWALLNFLHPERAQFADKERFVEQFGEMQSAAEARALHRIISPYILRREKGDVETNLKPLEETIVYVELTPFQKRCYRAIYENNADALLQGCVDTRNKPNLVSMMSALRLCCGHPFLVKGVEEAEVRRLAALPGDDPLRRALLQRGPRIGSSHREWEASPEMVARYSGKLVLLDKLLAKLKREGHRVLIFSFFKVFLDVVEYVLGDRGYTYERLDGDLAGSMRQTAMDRFNRPDGAFCFLLTTRAGGVGLNLQAADTVIMMDSDWNPQNDLQARARCHRIGQTKNVTVYRVVTRRSYEEVIFERANRKLGLERAVHAGAVNGPPRDDLEIERLLRLGAYHLGNPNEDDGESTSFVNADIDEILAKSAKTTTTDASASGGGSFSVANFAVEEDDFWSKQVGLVRPTSSLGTGSSLEDRARRVAERAAGKQSYYRNLEKGRKENEQSDSEDDFENSSSEDSSSEDEEEEVAQDSAMEVLPAGEARPVKAPAPKRPKVVLTTLPKTKRRRLEAALLRFGVDRLSLACEQAKLGPQHTDLVLPFVQEMLRACCACEEVVQKDLPKGVDVVAWVTATTQYLPTAIEHLGEDNRNKLLNSDAYKLVVESAPKLEPVALPTSPEEPQAPYTHLTESELDRFKRTGARIVRRLRSLAVLHAEILLSSVELPLDWWNSALTMFHLRSGPLSPVVAQSTFRAPSATKKFNGSPLWNVNSDQDTLLCLIVYEKGWDAPGKLADLVLPHSPEFLSRCTRPASDLDDPNADPSEVSDDFAILENGSQLSARVRIVTQYLERERKRRCAVSEKTRLDNELKQARKAAQEAFRLRVIAEREQEARKKRALQLAEERRREAMSKQAVAAKIEEKAANPTLGKAEFVSFMKAHQSLGETFHLDAARGTLTRMWDPAFRAKLKSSSLDPLLLYSALCTVAGSLALVPEDKAILATESEMLRPDPLLTTAVEALRASDTLDAVSATRFIALIKSRISVRNLLQRYAKTKSLPTLEASKRPKSIPSWWKPEIHDEALVKGVTIHGLGEARFDLIWKDPSLGFKGLDKDWDYQKGKARNMTFYPKPDICVALLDAHSKSMSA